MLYKILKQFTVQRMIITGGILIILYLMFSFKDDLRFYESKNIKYACEDCQKSPEVGLK